LTDSLPIALIGNEDYASEEATWEILLAYNRRTTQYNLTLPAKPGGTNPMRMAGVNQSLKWIWIAGMVLWLAAMFFLLWKQYNAGCACGHLSSDYLRIVPVSLFGTFWGISAALWQARQKKIGKREG
jgi:hypothetical protein